MRVTPCASQALTTCSSRVPSSQVWPKRRGRPVPSSTPSTARRSSLKNEWVASGIASPTAPSTAVASPRARGSRTTVPAPTRRSSSPSSTNRLSAVRTVTWLTPNSRANSWSDGKRSPGR